MTNRTYQDFRKAGYSASHAHYAAKAITDFAVLDDDKVKLTAEPEYENYFDVYGEPDGYTDIHGKHHSSEQERKEIEAQIERNGLYTVCAWYFDDQQAKWICCDSVGMCIYDDPLDPLQNCYVPDLMRSAVQHYNAQYEPVI